MNPTVKFAIILVAVLALAIVAALVSLAGAKDIVLGGKDFTEQSILCEMMAILIEENTDLAVTRRPFLGGTMVCFNALRGGNLDAYAEYTGTGLVNILNEEVVNDPGQVYQTVKTRFDATYDLVWLEPFGFNNTYALAMRRNQADELGIRTISDLAAYLRDGGSLTAGFTHEFLDRPDGYPGLAEAYDMAFPDRPRGLDPGLMYQACADGSVYVICAFATDGRIEAFELVTLDDDRRFFPPYQAAPLVRQDTLAAHPELRDVLNRLAGRLDDATMRRLNYQVDRRDDPRKAADVARAFLRREGLIGSQQE